jgi:HSP20 family protein
MNVTRWSPMDEMETMRRQMDRLLEQMIGSSSGRGFAGLPQLEAVRAFSPSIEIYSTDNEVVIKAELPGIDPTHVSVEVTAEAVHLTGELTKEEEIKEDNYYRSERQYGQFERLIPLPNRIKDAEAKATFEHGVLTIRAPLAEEVKKPQVRKLQIESKK